MSKNSNKKVFAIGGILVLIVIGLFVWNHYKQNKVATPELVIATNPVFRNILQVTAQEAAKEGVKVKLVEFSDWNTPNITLDHGDIDANFFQHQPFLTNAIKEGGYHIKPFAAGAASRVGLYSKKYKNLDEIPNQARVAIPNDPVNEGRALLLLNEAHLIQLKDPTNHLSTLRDITSNPKNLQFIEMEGPQTARAVDDVDLAFTYPHYLKLSKTIDPEKALYLNKEQDKRYAILFVVRDDFKDPDDQLKKFVHIYQNSPVVKDALAKEVGATLWYPGW